MKQVYIRFLNELTDFLPLNRAGNKFVYPFKGSPSVKHVIESIGVPHTEVGEIIVNGDCVDNTFGVYDQYDILVTQITNFKHLLDKDHRYYNKFRIYTNCNQIYWKGSNYKRLKEFLDDIIQKRRTYRK